MRRGVLRDNFFVDHVRYGTDNRAVAVIERPGVVLYEKKKKRVPAAMCRKGRRHTSCETSGHHVRLLSRCSEAIEITGMIIVGETRGFVTCGTKAKTSPSIGGEVECCNFQA